MQIRSLIDELESQKPLKWDKRLYSSQIEMALEETNPVLWIQNRKFFYITKSCHTQIAEKLEIPIKYYHKMEETAPELLAENVNT